MLNCRFFGVFMIEVSLVYPRRLYNLLVYHGVYSTRLKSFCLCVAILYWSILYYSPKQYTASFKLFPRVEYFANWNMKLHLFTATVRLLTDIHIWYNITSIAQVGHISIGSRLYCASGLNRYIHEYSKSVARKRVCLSHADFETKHLEFLLITNFIFIRY